jgi:hypothetical protein
MKKLVNPNAEKNVQSLKQCEEILNNGFRPSQQAEIYDSIIFLGLVTLENITNDDESTEMPVQQVGFVGGNGDGIARLFGGLISEDPRIFREIMRGYSIAVQGLREQDDKLKLSELEKIVDSLPDYIEEYTEK